MIACVLLGAALALGDFPDPAPPAVAALEATPPAEAAAYAGLVRASAPPPLSTEATVEAWPMFLGPRRDAHSRETHLLAAWDDDHPPALVWTAPRGHGFSCPVVAEGRLVSTHRIGNEAVVDCLDPETGLRFWRFSYPCDYRGRYISDIGPRSTPVIHRDRAYVHGVEGMLHCFELATGRVVWRRDLAAEFDVPPNFFGVVSSPLVYHSTLIVNLGAPGGPSVVAFDLDSGRLVWGAGREWGAGCASPVVAEMRGRDRLFVLAGGESRPPSGGLMVLDPRTGAIEHTHPFRSRTYESVNGASPVVAGDRVVLSAAYNTGTTGLTLGADDAWATTWYERRLGQEFANPVFHDGFIYMVDGVYDRVGEVVCLDPATGAERSRTEIVFDETVWHDGEEKTISASIGEAALLHVDSSFLALGDQGHLLRIACTPQGATVTARANLFHARQSWTPPVVHRGLLFVCQTQRERFGRDPQNRRLLCFSLRAP